MDLVECEAPLDSSFQKDRLELVNKGSLGRRRKPSRSNLRLILSPANDRQDIDVFHNHQHLEFDASFSHGNGTPTKSSKDSILDNQQGPGIVGRLRNSTDYQKRDICPKNYPQNGVSNNYREVVQSINQIHGVKCVDFNGNSHQPTSEYRQNFTNGDHVSIIQNGQYKVKPENNNVKLKHHFQTSVIRNQLNADTNSHQVFTKLNNSNDVTKSNIHHSTLVSKNQNTSESKSCQKAINIRNQQRNERTFSSNHHQNTITFSNHRQIVTSTTPIQTKKPTVPSEKHQDRTSSQDGSSKVYIESSLPRTSKEPDLVAEAQQFSIEAKLKRKKTEVQGRSAVLIQTWERRTQSESHSKLRRDSKTILKNRFSGKEISDANSTAMPDSYICVQYKGSLQNGDNLLQGELVRDVRPDETMLYRVPENRHRTVELARTTDDRVAVNGKSSVQEPEWISLSRKLCAKFVEGHIESHSPDSYPHEEPEGVGEESSPSLQSIKTHSDTNTTIQTEVQKRKIIPTTPCEETSPSDEPPWIHLSRKLCTKFIEEHIEYPPITNGHFIEVPELIEPNGDVRIIEKIGKPKGHKSKQKKECEPEWISLSKKLRAKFIESHIDDPDTIALDNQLNASDPEETGSETLSDISQETSVPKKVTESQKAVECRNFTVKSEIVKEKCTYRENEDNQTRNKSAVLPEKECCWEYQEMEFDQESNSGNFQEIECFDQPSQEENYKLYQEPLSQDYADKFGERMSFENLPCSQQNPECYNNDVKFAPRDSTNEPGSDCPQKNKLITVQFIAHNDSNYKIESMNDASNNTKDIKLDSVFNHSTWEQAQCKQDESAQQITEDSRACKECLSKSVGNIGDTSEKNVFSQNEDFDRKETRNSPASANAMFSVENHFSESENFINNKGNDMHFQDFKLDPEYSSNMSSTRNSPNYITEDMIGESEGNKTSWSKFYEDKKQNIYDAINMQSSSEDEVFECDYRNKQLNSNHSKIANCDEISARKSPSLENDKFVDPKKINDEKLKSDPSKKNTKNIKCNGMIPNSIYDGFSDNKKPPNKINQNEVSAEKTTKEPTKLGMSKWITISKSEQNISKPEYSNIQASIHKEQSNGIKPLEVEAESKNKLKKNKKESKNMREKKTDSHVSDKETMEDAYKFNGSFKESDLKSKWKSLCDISYIQNESNFRQHESIADLCSATKTPNRPKIEFQHFEFNSEIPLCAKLVSKHDRKSASASKPELSTNRIESPCPSESSHVYEDMFKETPSGPSDSEASSWTAVKNNTYYVAGRSCSMNDLDFSDSCSLSVKCDYASSSENSTLQSRRSSYASSSFYVNLRDYDSHMLEPNLSKGKKHNARLANNGTTSSISKSNPPTPESLRHLFTSPLSSVHSPPNRTPRLLNRMPSDPQSHYYSTAAATSSAFKHGFNITPPKPKKTERSSSMKIKDIAHGIILTFRKLQSSSKSSSVSSLPQVDVSHLAEMKSNSELGKSKKAQKDSKKQKQDKNHWTENGKTDTDSGFLSDVQRAKARRSSSDLTGMKPNPDLFHSEKKKGKSSKKGSKGKKSKVKVSEPRTVPTVSRKVQQMADGTLYLVTTVSGDTTLPGVYSDSPDTSSELSSHRPVKLPEESNC